MPLNIRVDTHAHVFDSSCRLVPGRRYTPKSDAPLESYRSELEAAGMSHGVLIQPSFLGTDNSFILSCLEAYPDQLRGIAVIDPNIGQAELESIASRGIAGIRLNLLGCDPHVVQSGEWQTAFERIAALDWQIEVQVESRYIPLILSNLLPSGVNIVIDHFGKPDAKLGVADPGFIALLEGAQCGHLWVKLSAPYRCGGVDIRPYAHALISEFGPQRLLWGSDWPWLQHEEGKKYPPLLDELKSWVPDPIFRGAILGSTALDLFAFDGPELSAKG